MTLLEEIQGLNTLLQVGSIDRATYYLKVFELTESNAAILQLNISQFSGAIGGAAHGANYLLTDGAKNTDPSTNDGLGLTGYSDNDPINGNEIYQLSQQVAIDFGIAVEADIINGGTGDLSISEGADVAEVTWQNFSTNLQPFFPGGFLADLVEGVFEPGFQIGVAGFQAAFMFGKSVSDYRDASGNFITEVLADGREVQYFGRDINGTEYVVEVTLDNGQLPADLPLSLTLDDIIASSDVKIVAVDNEFGFPFDGSQTPGLGLLLWPDNFSEIREWEPLVEFRRQLIEGDGNFTDPERFFEEHYPEIAGGFWGALESTFNLDADDIRNDFYVFDRFVDQSASADAEFLYGGGGDDILLGGTGNDRLDGAEGADTLTGGSGSDTFVFSSMDFNALTLESSQDVILDFNTGELDSLVFKDLDVSDISGMRSGNDLIIEYDNEGIGTGDSTVTIKDFFANGQEFGFINLKFEGDAGQPESLPADLGFLPFVVTNTGQIVDLRNENKAGFDDADPTNDPGVAFPNPNPSDVVINITTPGDDVFTGTGLDEQIIDRAGGSNNFDMGDGNDRVSIFDTTNSPDITSNIVRGGRGGDRIDLADGDFNFVDAGTGSDLVDINGGANSFIVLGAGDDLGGFATFNGGDHVFLGGDGADTFDGFFSSGFSVDTLVLDGGPGNDVFNGLGSVQTAFIFGGSGDDTAETEFFDTEMSVYFMGSGIDTVNIGGDGPAFVFGEEDNDTLDLSLVAAAGSLIDGGTGDDTLTGSDFADTLIGGVGDDTVLAMGGDDTIVAGSGAGDDTYDGGTGDDTITYRSTSDGVTVNLRDGLGFGTEVDNDTIAGIENAEGGMGDDIFIGNMDVNRFTGGGGADSFEPGSGAAFVTDYDAASGDNIVLAPAVGADFTSIRVGDNLEFATVAAPSAPFLTIENFFINNASINLDLGDGNGVASFAVDDAGKVDIDGGGGNNMGTEGDDILTGTEGVDMLSGLGGNDQIFGLGDDDELDGGTGNDTLDGGAGNDTLIGNEGDDIVFGGDGDDIIIAGSGAGNDQYDGGAGTDTILYSSTTQGVTVDLAAGIGFGAEVDSDSITGVENIIAGHGDDILTGDAGDNVISGLAGADTYHVSFNAGDDTIIDQSNDGSVDQIIFGTGITTDALFFTASVDDMVITADGMAGSVTIAGWFVSTDNQIEEFVMDNGLTFDAGNVADAIANGGRLDLAPDANDDAVDANNTGEATGNVLTNDSDPNGDNFTLTTGTFNTANGGNVTLNADGSFFYAAAAGFVGTDSFTYTITDDFGETGVGTVILNNVEANAFGTTSQDDIVFGTRGDDVIDGLGGDDRLFGRRGDDTINGGDGDDLIKGGRGNDIMDGGDGIDTVSFAGSSKSVWVNLKSGMADGKITGWDSLSNIENVIGGRANDKIFGDNVDNVLNGRQGNDLLWGLGGDDTLIGGNGNDKLFGGSGDDTLIGGKGNDKLIGGWGEDTADYSSSNSDIDVSLKSFWWWGSFGHAKGADIGKDHLSSIENIVTGSGDDDFFIKGHGDHTLTTGAGQDSIILQDTKSTNTITDFDLGNDSLDIADVLKGYDPLEDALADFVMTVTTPEGHTQVQVSAKGNGVFETVATLENLSTDLTELVDHGGIVV